jgi:hypothetical protein
MGVCLVDEVGGREEPKAASLLSVDAVDAVEVHCMSGSSELRFGG